MKRKVILLLSMVLIFTGIISLNGFNGADTLMAAPAFQRVDFVDAVVTAQTLNVRQGASVKFPVVCVLKNGESIKIFGKIGDWYAVYEPKTGCVGAVSNKYVKTGTGSAKKPNPSTPMPKTTKAPAAPIPKVTQAPAKGTPAPVDGVSKDEQEVLDLVNKARANAGVGPLAFDMNLMKVARLKSKDMVDNNYFSHQSPTYGSPFDMMRQFGISFNTAGENIAGNQTVKGAFDAWMNSEGHRKNILNGSFNYTGIGIVSSPTYGKMFTQQFIGR